MDEWMCCVYTIIELACMHNVSTFILNKIGNIMPAISIQKHVIQCEIGPGRYYICISYGLR